MPILENGGTEATISDHPGSHSEGGGGSGPRWSDFQSLCSSPLCFTTSEPLVLSDRALARQGAGPDPLGGPHRPSSGFWHPGLRTTAFLSLCPAEAFAGGGEAHKRSRGGWDDSSRTHQVTDVEF